MPLPALVSLPPEGRDAARGEIRVRLRRWHLANLRRITTSDTPAGHEELLHFPQARPQSRQRAEHHRVLLGKLKI
eukprot:1157621-Pelagomonas_calceolata.AAC.3